MPEPLRRFRGERGMADEDDGTCQPCQCKGAWAPQGMKESSENHKMIKCKTYSAGTLLAFGHGFD